MIKSLLDKFLKCSLVGFLAFQSCKDDSYLATPLPIPDQSFVEEFDSLDVAMARGWIIKNRSEPIGVSTWMQGGVGTAYSSKATNIGFISADHNSCKNMNPYEGTISNWVISPPVILQNSDRIIFYTRTNNPAWGDRLQVRINPLNDGADCGNGLRSGDFTILLLDINPSNASNDERNLNNIPTDIYKYDPANAFPAGWTRFEAQITNLDKPHKGRFGFRYFVPKGGSQGLGNDILIDSVAFVSASHL